MTTCVTSCLLHLLRSLQLRSISRSRCLQDPQRYFKKKKHAIYYTSGHRMHEALPSPPVEPSPLHAWLDAQYSIISKASIRSHLRQILLRLSTRARIVGESARNLWGYVHRSFDAGIANSNSPGQLYPLLLPATPLRHANLTLTCVYWFTNREWRPRSEPSVLFPGRCVYCIVLFFTYRLSIDSQHIDKNTKIPTWMYPSSVNVFQTGQLEAASDVREHEEKSNRRRVRTNWFNVTLDESMLGRTCSLE